MPKSHWDEGEFQTRFPSGLCPWCVFPWWSVSAWNASFCPLRCSWSFPLWERVVLSWLPGYALLQPGHPSKGGKDTFFAREKGWEEEWYSDITCSSRNYKTEFITTNPARCPRDFLCVCHSVLISILSASICHGFGHQTCISVTLVSIVFNLRPVMQLSCPTNFGVSKK